VERWLCLPWGSVLSAFRSPHPSITFIGGKHVDVAKASQLDKQITQKFQKNKDISSAILCPYTVL
jgi:hypothetical protein